MNWWTQPIPHLTGASDESADGDSGVHTKALLKCEDLATVGVKVNRCSDFKAYRSCPQEAVFVETFTSVT